MSIAHPKPADGAPVRDAGGIRRLLQAGERVVTGQRETRIVAATLGAFVVVWLLYHTVSLITVDLRWDASEAAVWAQHFAFGYKHPPMTAWLFAAWFAIWPRTDWAMHLLAVVIVAVTLAIIWRLSRDHLDKERTLLGLAALLLVPLFTFKAAELNANTALMPFWAAALLFYLRARRGLGMADALLAGACASAALLAKYWAVYLFAGMAVAALLGPDRRRFWRAPAPYLMAAGAAIVIAPHVYWYVTQMGGSNYAFVRDSVMTEDSLGAALARSAHYLLGAIAYAIGPLLLLAALRPSRAALADTLWPADAMRRQAVILFAVPLVLPALVNVVVPHRLTADWTFPNWALLPVVLYGSRLLAIDALATATAGCLAAAVGLAALFAAPVVAYHRLIAGPDHNRPDSRMVAVAARRVDDQPVRFYWGSAGLTGGLSFYDPPIRPLEDDPLTDAGRAATAGAGLIIACLDGDAGCLKTEAALTPAGGGGAHGARSADQTVRHHFLGFAGPPIRFHLTVLPAAAQ